MFSSINYSSFYMFFQWLKQQWNKLYAQTRLVLTDEPIIYNPEEYFPKDVQKVLLKNKEFLQNIKFIKKEIKQKQYYNGWLVALRKFLEQIKQDKFVSYFGLIFWTRTSNEIQKRDSIVKQENRLIRTLVQCPLIAKRYGICLAHSPVMYKLAAALAKLFYQTLKNWNYLSNLKEGWIFENLPNFILNKELKT